MVTCSQKACFRLFERGVGAAGPLFVALAIVLIFGSAFVYFYILLPFIYPDGSYFHTLIPAWLVVLIGFNYAAAVMTPPGSNTHLDFAHTEEARRDTRPSEDDGSHMSLTRQSSSDSEDLQRSSDHFVDVSLHQVSFPPCKKYAYFAWTTIAVVFPSCLLSLSLNQSFLAWMSNCIGNFNHRYFYLFLFYLTVGCHYLCAISFRLFFATITDIMAKKVPPHARLIIGVWMLAFLMGIAIGVLCGYHTYLILSNLTTIEHYAYKDQAAVSAFDGEAHFNEYDIGRWENLRAFFGTRHKPLYYILLPLRVPPNSNGLQYPTLRLNPLHLT